MKDKKSHQTIGILSLLVVTLFWGFGFVGLVYVERVPTFWVQAIRFTIASVILALVFPKHLKHLDKRYLKVGLEAGFFMFLAYVGATVGIRYTMASRAAFFSCLSALCVPIIMLICFKLKPTKKNILCLAICVVGVYMISMGGTGEHGFRFGDVICLGTSFVTACEMVVVDRNIEDMDPIALSIIELGVISVFSFICIPIFGETLPTDWTVREIGAMLFMGICCSALAFVFKIYGQKQLPANRASLIMTMEPVIGGIGSWWLLSERMGVMGWTGAIIVVIAIILSEYNATDTKD